jgi:hypothetical protein
MIASRTFGVNSDSGIPMTSVVSATARTAGASLGRDVARAAEVRWTEEVALIDVLSETFIPIPSA